MERRLVVGLLAAVSCLSFASLSRAECTKDTDCKGDRVCEAGVCVAPAALPPPPAAPSGAPAPPTAQPAGAAGSAAATPPSQPLVAPAAPALSPTPPVEPLPPLTEAPPKPRRHSTGMMVGGIVMTSFSPVALLVAWVADIEQQTCKTGNYFNGTVYQQGTDCSSYDSTIYGGLISAAVLAGVGIPLIIIGGKKEPVGTARLTPWSTPHSAGLNLRVDL